MKRISLKIGKRVEVDSGFNNMSSPAKVRDGFDADLRRASRVAGFRFCVGIGFLIGLMTIMYLDTIIDTAFLQFIRKRGLLYFALEPACFVVFWMVIYDGVQFMALLISRATDWCWGKCTRAKTKVPVSEK